jgi:hypothetical protein
MAQHPCSLVTRAEIAVLSHHKVASETNAPLGPTCVIQLSGAAQSITIAVDAVNIPSLVKRMPHKPVQLTLTGRRAYCGVLGKPLLSVGLGGGYALQIGAPCPLAENLARKALRRLSA